MINGFTPEIIAAGGDIMREKALKINVRVLQSQDIDARGLPKNTKGLVITKIANDSPVNYLNIGNIILEAQKKAIKTVGDLEIAINSALKSSEKTLLIVILFSTFK